MSMTKPAPFCRREDFGMAIDPEVRELAQGKNFAAFTSLLPGGSPMTHMMWVDCDDDYILINTEVHRGKYKNVVADARVAVIIMDSNDDGRYADVTGRVVERITGPKAREHIDKLAQRYMGQPFNAGLIRSERVILRIEPDRQRVRHNPA
jgi:PPOX class probable F420-dependent enzyme